MDDSEKDELISSFNHQIYERRINKRDIESIIAQMPKGLSELEKAYYIYVQIGKIVKENPDFFVPSKDNLEEIYNQEINEKDEGICKSIAELYVAVLKDKRIGIDADLVKMHPHSPIGHIDVVIKIDGKRYLVNLISDSYRIKAKKRVKSFGFDLSKVPGPQHVQDDYRNYLRRLVNYYGRIDTVSEQEIEAMDKKINYSYHTHNMKPEERGIYSEDTIYMLKKEFRDINSPEFKKHVLLNRQVDESDILVYKLEYISRNIEKLIEFDGNINFLDIDKLYRNIVTKILEPKELDRIEEFNISLGKDVRNRLMIIKVKPSREGRRKGKRNVYLKKLKNEKSFSRTTIYETSEIFKVLGNARSADQIAAMAKFYATDREDEDIDDNTEWDKA